jgi:RimJ/RimL family protein N-acetyltransferase
VDLTTERLILRPIGVEHVAAVMDSSRQPDWADDFPDEGDRVIAGVLRRLGVPSGLDAEFGHRLIIERATGLVVGGVGLFGPPVSGRVEIGYGVVPSRRGRGYASEAVRALAGFALSDAVEVFAGVEPSNVASARVLEKAGFVRAGETDKEVTFTMRR